MEALNRALCTKPLPDMQHLEQTELAWLPALMAISLQLAYLEGQGQVAAFLVDLDDSVTDVGQHQLAIPVVVQHVKGLLGLLW